MNFLGIFVGSSHEYYCFLGSQDRSNFIIWFAILVVIQILSEDTTSMNQFFIGHITSSNHQTTKDLNVLFELRKEF